MKCHRYDLQPGNRRVEWGLLLVAIVVVISGALTLERRVTDQMDDTSLHLTCPARAPQGPPGQP